MKQTLIFHVVTILGLLTAPAEAQVERVWMTHRSSQPDQIVINWTTKTPGSSVVRYRTKIAPSREVRVDGERTLHHVEIPLKERNTEYYYTVETEGQSSSEASFKSLPVETLRVAVAANWQRHPELSAMLRDDPHLLLTAGDHVNGLWQKCGAGEKECVQPFAEWIDTYPQLFRRVPIMPVLGNHDREIRPRGKEPPAEPVYDIDATAYRRFFKLPGDAWKWTFDIPDFNVRFIALDLNHISDHGTAWQSCHGYCEHSEQLLWYEQLMQQRQDGFVVTLYNERNASVRPQANGKWESQFRKGDVCITGYGHFGERAELDGVLYYNTSLQGYGNRYPDPHSTKLISADNYLLLTFDAARFQMTVEIKDLEGVSLDRVQLTK